MSPLRHVGHQVENGDLTWIVPGKLIAFAGPAGGEAHYAPLAADTTLGAGWQQPTRASRPWTWLRAVLPRTLPWLHRAAKEIFTKTVGVNAARSQAGRRRLRTTRRTSSAWG